MAVTERFPSFPDDAQLWIYPADRRLMTSDGQRLSDLLVPFFGAWNSHGAPVRGALAVVADRFVLIAAHLPGDTVSGCGIDALTDALHEAGAAIGLTWASSLLVFFRAGEQVESVSRKGFRELSRSGDVGPETVVYDLSIRSVGALRQGAFERPAQDSWHARLLETGSSVG